MILKLSYIGLSLLMILVQLLIAKYAISKTFDIKKGKKKLIIVAMFILLWHGYIKLLSYLGVLHNMDFPPRFAIFLIISTYYSYSTTSRPIDVAEPLTICIQASSSDAFMSAIFFLATLSI